MTKTAPGDPSYFKKDMTPSIRQLPLMAFQRLTRTLFPGESMILHTLVSKEASPLLLAFLLDCGVNPNVPDKNGFTPLHHAVFGKREKAIPYISLLLSHGANPELPDNEGNTPLHCAFTWAHSLSLADNSTFYLPIYRTLLRGGSSPNTWNSQGNTLLHRAVLTKKKKEIYFFLRHGSDDRLENSRGLRPSDVTHDEEVADLLIQHSAKKEKKELQKAAKAHSITLPPPQKRL